MRTACTGRGGGGSGKLKVDKGLAVEAMEYTGDPGIAGSWEGVGEAGRDVVGEAISRAVFVWIRSEDRQRSNGDYEGGSMSEKENVVPKNQSAQCAIESRSRSAIEGTERRKMQLGEARGDRWTGDAVARHLR